MTSPRAYLSTRIEHGQRTWSVIVDELPCCREQPSREAALGAVASLRFAKPARWPVWDGDAGAFLADGEAEQLR